MTNYDVPLTRLRHMALYKCVFNLFLFDYTHTSTDGLKSESTVCQDEKGTPDRLVNDEDCITIMLLLY